jgi:hypothetical protein
MIGKCLYFAKIILKVWRAEDQGYQNQEQITAIYQRVCPSQGLDIARPWIQFHSIVLVILMNWPMFSVIPLVELIYRPFFPTIVYCVPQGKIPDGLKDWKLTFVNYTSEGQGYNNYICIDEVHNLKLDAKGYFFIADDLLVRPSVVKNFSLDIPSMHFGKRFCDMSDQKSACNSWVWFGQSKLKKHNLEQNLQREKNITKDLYTTCKTWHKNISQLDNPLIQGWGDIYFIPASFMESAARLARLYHRSRVFLEVAVIEMVTCLSQPALPYDIPGFASWDYGNRDQFWQNIPRVTSGKSAFLHPVKLSFVLKNETQAVNSICQDILPYFHINNKTKNR